MSRFNPTQKVVAAIHFDDNQDRVIQWAAHMAKILNQELHLVHIIEPYLQNLLPASHLLDAVWEISQKWLTKQTEEVDLALKRIAEVYQDKQKVTYASHIGNVGTWLKAICEQQTSLLILGAQKRTALTRGWSTAFEMADTANVPLMIVGDDCLPPSGKIAKLLVADDLTHRGEDSTRFAFDLASYVQGCKVKHVHASQLEKEKLALLFNETIAYAGESLSKTVKPDEVAAKTESILMSRLRHRFEPWKELFQSSDCEYAASIVYGDIAEKLSETAKNFAPNIEVYGRHRSYEDGLFRLGHVPVNTMLDHEVPVIIA